MQWVLLQQRIIELNYMQVLMVPIFLVAGFYGWKRGWREEAITGVGLIIALFMFSNETIAGNIANLLNRIVGAFGIFLDALLGGDRSNAEPIIDTTNFATFQFIAFVLGIIAAYIVGSAIGRRSEVEGLGRFFGIMIGLFNAYLVLSKIFDFWLARDRQGAELPFDDGAQIIVTPMPPTNELRSNLPTIFALMFLIVLVVTFFRLPKIRQ